MPGLLDAQWLARLLGGMSGNAAEKLMSQDYNRYVAEQQAQGKAALPRDAWEIQQRAIQGQGLMGAPKGLLDQ